MNDRTLRLRITDARGVARRQEEDAERDKSPRSAAMARGKAIAYSVVLGWLDEREEKVKNGE